MKEIRELNMLALDITLSGVAENDPSRGGVPEGSDGTAEYAARERLIWQAAGCAASAGYRVGVKIDPAQPDWPVLYIDLPDGQVSWHMAAYPGEYDGHTTAEKYDRIKAFSGRVDRFRFRREGSREDRHADLDVRASSDPDWVPGFGPVPGSSLGDLG